MNFVKSSFVFGLLYLFTYFESYEGSYYRFGQRCLYGNCDQYPNHYYARPASNWRITNQLYSKPTYAKPAYFRTSYSPYAPQPNAYQFNYPSWSRVQPHQPNLRAESPYEVVEIVGQPNPESLAYYPVPEVARSLARVSGERNSIEPHRPSRIMSAIEREEPIVEVVSDYEPVKSTYELNGENEIEHVDPTYGGASNDPPTCKKHEECTKFCVKTINSVGVFGSCYHGSCRCGIRN